MTRDPWKDFDGLPWRVGRKVGRTVYDCDDHLIGVMDTPELASFVVYSANLALGVQPAPNLEKSGRDFKVGDPSQASTGVDVVPDARRAEVSAHYPSSALPSDGA